MSYITEIVLHGPLDTTINSVNRWLLDKDKERGQQFRRIDTEQAGGTKVFCSDIWAAAFNCAPAGLREKLQDPATWGNFALMVFGIIDDEDTSTVFMFGYDDDDNIVCLSQHRDF